MVYGKRRPTGRGMAGIADVGTVDMARTLTGGDAAVVTFYAHPGTYDLGVIHISDRREGIDIVAVLAKIRGTGMAGGLADGYRIIVATKTTTVDVAVIHLRHRGPAQGCGIVASLEGIAGINVRAAFAAGNGIIVAGETSAYDLAVIHRCRRHRRPTGREFLVAQLTLIGGVNVLRGFAGGIHAVVATNTVVGDDAMIHTGGNPGGGAVANTAIGSGGHVPCILALGNATVMAELASPNDLIVVHS